jgi:hypothetical protein
VEEVGESSERRGRGGCEAVWKRRERRLCGRDGRGACVEETGPSHPGGMDSRAKGSGPNTGAGNGDGVGST